MIGEVVKSGRTVSLVDGRAWALGEGGRRTLVATMTATMMTVVARDDVKD
jgi:acyl-coenzyme A thioesterase PaaI-like protein